MQKLLYIGTPAAVGLLLLLVLSLCYFALIRKNWQIKVSFWSAIAHGALAAVSVAFTYERSISSQACLTAIFGTFVALGLAVLDTINLLWWFIRSARVEKTIWLPLPLAFVVVRLLIHAAFTLSLWWCAQLCTV